MENLIHPIFRNGTDDMKTEVLFLYHEANKDLFAFFPNIHESGDNKLCYSSNGQHSDCGWDYVDECRFATKAEYSDLEFELIKIGYKLKTIKTK